MAARSGIEWTSATWNPIVGCSLESPACVNCYAMKMAARIERMSAGTGRPTHYAGTTKPSKAGPVWTGVVREAPGDIFVAPMRWRRPRTIFVNSMADLFEPSVPFETVDRVFAIMALTPQHTYQVLTKRPARMRQYFEARTPVEHLNAWALAHAPGRLPMSRSECMARLSPDATPIQRSLYNAVWPRFPLTNVWLGTSAEDQRRADERLPELQATPAAIRFLSAEPLLGPLQLADHLATLDWVIVGGESGPNARPMHPDWARSIRDQCISAEIPFFFKQWGEFREFVTGSPQVELVHCGTDAADMYIAAAVKPSWLSITGRHYLSADDLPVGVGARLLERVGKRAAGRLLDGHTHDDLPILAA